MYCSHCGKKVGDAMLFCPFCGEPIVIPEQDEPTEAAPVPVEAPAKAVPVTKEEPAEPAPLSEPESETKGESASDDATRELLDWTRERKHHADVWAREEAEAFQPLELEQDDEPSDDWKEEISRKKEAAVQEKKPPEMQRSDPDPVRLEGKAPRLESEVKGAKPAGGESSGKAARKHANTLVPPKTMDPDDIFMDGRGMDYDDDQDPYDDDGDDAFTEDFAYEEDDGGFFMRHLRGIVGLALFVILLLLFVIYAFSKAGQVSLARANLAWSTEAYVTLGNQSYQSGEIAYAAQCYERALQRDPDNYSYASSAAMAYFEAGDTDKTASMLKKCLEIDPAQLDPYIYLLNMYPEAASRPWDVTQLLQQGYKNTGDSRLNVTG